MALISVNSDVVHAGESGMLSVSRGQVQTESNLRDLIVLLISEHREFHTSAASRLHAMSQVLIQLGVSNMELSTLLKEQREHQQRLEQAIENHVNTREKIMERQLEIALAALSDQRETLRILDVLESRGWLDELARTWRRIWHAIRFGRRD